VQQGHRQAQQRESVVGCLFEQALRFVQPGHAAPSSGSPSCSSS
jgi:hypothetical protein